MAKFTAHTFAGYAWVMDVEATLAQYGSTDGPTVAVEDKSGRRRKFATLAAAQKFAVAQNAA